MTLRALWQATAIAGVCATAAMAAPGIPAHPEVPVGGFPTGIAVDPASATVYVGNGDTNTLSLIDATTCNATTTGGCGRFASAATGGIDPIGAAVDAATRTLYVANASGSVAVLDAARCRAGRRSGCRRPLAVVPVGPNPQFLAVDRRTHTVYVANSDSSTVSVIDAHACNAAATAGCRRPHADAAAGPAPFAIAVDDATGSVYVTNLAAHTVSVIDGTACNATVVSGCHRPPATVDVGEAPGGIALDARTHTVYVTGESSGDVSVIDASACSARMPRGCRRNPVRVPAGRGARGIAVDEATDTVYVADTAADTVSVIDGSRCNAEVHSGCRARAAVAPVGISPRRVAVDERTDTVYVTNAGSNSVTVLDGATCNGRVHSGCARAR